jgi:hypothetical protein
MWHGHANDERHERRRRGHNASSTDAVMRETATGAGPRPASTSRRSAPREDAAWKNPSVPETNAAAQLALSATAASPASEPPSAEAKSLRTPAAEMTNRAGTATSRASMKGARSCSRANTAVRVIRAPGKARHSS